MSQALQLQLQSTISERDTLQSETATLRDRLAELVGVQEELAVLQGQHEAATTRLAQLEEQHEVCVSVEMALNKLASCVCFGSCGHRGCAHMVLATVLQTVDLS